MPEPDQRERFPVSTEIAPVPASEREPASVEQPETKGEQPSQAPMPAAESPARPAVVQPTAPPVPVKSPLVREIEDVLSEDLLEVYRSMTPQQQEEFKVKGEQAASKIAELLQSIRVQSQKILGLIKDWLRLIPGVNRFFLEQEAKIKTDKILALGESERQPPQP